MSKHKKKLLPAPNRENDFTDSDLAVIKKFEDEGRPGLMSVNDVLLKKVIELYMSGKTYREICDIAGIKRGVLLYLSKRFNWFNMKLQYLEELDQSMQDRLIQNKLESQNFLLLMSTMWQKKIGDSAAKYIMTGDKTHADAIDLKELDKLLKVTEMLHKLGETRLVGPTSPISINMTDGMTIKKTEEGTMEITPKSPVGDMLKKFADMRRSEEREATEVKSDIKKIETNKGNSNE